MGHYCETCGEKLIGGIVPTSCDCVECYCTTCWKQKFTETFVKSDKHIYEWSDKEYVKVNEPMYTAIMSEPKCEHCGEIYNEKSTTYY